MSDETDLSDAGDTTTDAADRAAIEAELAEVRARVLEAPAESVVINHVMGLYELAAIHLSAATPDLGAASLAIDAVACLVDGLGDRLGDDVDTMRDALANIRMSFVTVRSRATEAPPTDD